MSQKLVNFNGLYGDTHAPLLPNFIHYEVLETRCKMYDWEIKKHLHTDLFQLFVLQEGDNILLVGDDEVILPSPSIVLIPTNTLHGFHFQPQIIGSVITFSESFLEILFKEFPQIILELNQLRYFSFKEHEAVFGQIAALQTEIIGELEEEKKGKQLVVQSLFQLLFVKLYRFIITQKEAFNYSDNRTLHYFQGFQKSIKRSIQESKSIEAYAHELGITSVHLNRICKSIAQKSALEIVQEYVVNEAKMYLLNTSYTISEISYFLNFKDPAYFTRVFRKKTGVSPTEFRGN